MVHRAASTPSSNDAAIASTTCGKNIEPYWVLESPYSAGSVNIVAAAGNVTSTTPCANPAAYTILDSAAVATFLALRWRGRGRRVRDHNRRASSFYGVRQLSHLPPERQPGPVPQGPPTSQVLRETQARPRPESFCGR